MLVVKMLCCSATGRCERLAGRATFALEGVSLGFVSDPSRYDSCMPVTIIAILLCVVQRP